MHERHLLRGGRPHLEDDIGRRPDGGSIGQYLGARGAVGIVAEIGGLTGTGFDADAKAQLDELFDHIGHGGHALFQREGFPQHAYALVGGGGHERESPGVLNLDSRPQRRPLLLPVVDQTGNGVCSGMARPESETGLGRFLMSVGPLPCSTKLCSSTHQLGARASVLAQMEDASRSREGICGAPCLSWHA